MTPRISVVMPTHNRADSLRQVLHALATQTAATTDYEVIVVADGCTDQTAAVAASLGPTLPFRLVFVEQPASGAAAARNAGVARTAAPLLLFLDDDMLAGPTLVEAHLEAHADGEARLVLGYFPIPHQLAERDPFAREARRWWDAGFAARRTAGYRFGFKDFCTGNVSLPAALFHAAGGFDPRIVGAGGEDYELGYRLLRQGARFRFAPRAQSLHQDVNSLARALRRARAEGVAHAHTVQRHIDLAFSFNLHRLGRLQSFPWRPVWRLAWAFPRAADAAAGLLKAAVVASARLNWTALTWRWYPGLAGHAYWQGVREVLGSAAAWQRLMQDAPHEPEDATEIDLDLSEGPAEQDIRLAGHADCARLYWRGEPIGRIPSVAGAERLSTPLVRAYARGFARDLLPRLTLPASWDRFRDLEPRGGVAAGDCPSGAGPARVAHVELQHPEHLWGCESYACLQLLVTDGGRPIADLALPLKPRTAVVTAGEIVAALARRGVRAGAPMAPRAPAPLPSISVVVCTRDRHHALRRCLRALERLDYPAFEVIVVDNASVTDATAKTVAATAFRCVREDRAGLDWARNRGIAEANFPIVAFVDDDAVVGRGWLTAIATAFEDPLVSGVTGLVLAAELAYPAQRLFEEYGGMGKGIRGRDLDGARLSPAERIAVHGAGVGANMAFRRATFERVGVFDTALDVGTPACGAGDLDMFHRVLSAGLAIRYAPSAFVWHHHRRSYDDLRRQLYNNGRAFGVYLVRIWMSRSVPRRHTLRYALGNWLCRWLLVRLLRVVTRRERFPVGLVLAELWGASHALWAYRQTYRADRMRRAAAGRASPSAGGV